MEAVDALAPDTVQDRESFFAFVRALAAGRRSSVAGWASQCSPEGPDAGGRENLSIPRRERRLAPQPRLTSPRDSDALGVEVSRRGSRAEPFRRPKGRLVAGPVYAGETLREAEGNDEARCPSGKPGPLSIPPVMVDPPGGNPPCVVRREGRGVVAARSAVPSLLEHPLTARVPALVGVGHTRLPRGRS